jgi:hypothetical protein
MAIVIAPWTVRNYRTFDRFVLVSTNGGLAMYGANNPRAHGGYVEEGPEEDLMRMPELEADREAKRRAAEWIVANPGRFLALAFEKNIRFMGDDSIGAYQTLRRGKGSSSEVVYAAAKFGSNAYWLAIWALLLCGLLPQRGGSERRPPEWLIVPFAFLYFLSLHSIVESNGKYHVLTIGTPLRSCADDSDFDLQAARKASPVPYPWVPFDRDSLEYHARRNVRSRASERASPFQNARA